MTPYQIRCTVAGAMAAVYFIEVAFIIRLLVEGAYSR
jgi:hypothetical protein